ncbi:MAG: pyridoxine 5-phosphate synthase [Bacteroidota bacterium]|nr:pyridoxine 5-phosphate synthase [Bacteroidota bacterium]
MINLNINIDHVATVRNARGGKEPDPIAAAIEAELAGASGIVCHLREDRRHVNDRDVKLLKEVINSKLDLEMAANPEIIQIALQLQPDMVTIVPEKRQELTTEGGLDVASNLENLKSLCGQMHSKGIEVSLFVEPSEEQIHASLLAGADMVELHTGKYANAKHGEEFENELARIHQAAGYAADSGLLVAAGHGLNYLNTKQICLIPFIHELSIGHSIISRAVFSGIQRAVREMIELINASTLQRNFNITDV